MTEKRRWVLGPILTSDKIDIEVMPVSEHETLVAKLKGEKTELIRQYDELYKMSGVWVKECNAIKEQLATAREALEKYLNYNLGGLREMADIMTHPDTIARETLAKIAESGPKERAEAAYQSQQKMLAANEELRRKGIIK